MTTTGIIAEFNPFHNGHSYLLDQAEGVKVIAMSGNFVQRGEPAIVDKWTRTQMALDNGADLVVELPFLVSVQAADFFAAGAVDILARLGVDQLAFGTEEMLDYEAIAALYAEKEQEMTAFLDSLPEALSYPQKTQAMWREFAGLSFSGSQPNHILALAYAKAAVGRRMALRPIKRQGAGFHSLADDQEFASATALRERLSDRAFVQRFSPAADLLAAAPRVSWQDFFPLLRYQIISHPDLTAVYQISQEAAVRIRQAAQSSSSVAELLELAATKRYTKARLRRMLTYILVAAREAVLPQAIHILGFSEQGRQHLSAIKNQVQLVSRIGREPWDVLTQQADRIYQLGNEAVSEQNHGRMPLRPAT